MMKATLFALFVALLMVGCGEEAVDYSKLQDRDGIMYLPNEETPFTGRAEAFYDNGQKKAEANFKDGKMVGLVTEWYDNGQKKGEVNFKDGKPDGLFIQYNLDGTEKYRFTYKDGEVVD